MISERISNARRQSGLKVKQAAKLLDMHHRRLEKMEGGKFNPTSRELEKMAQAYEVSVAYLEYGVKETLLDELADHPDAPEEVRLDIMKKWGAHIDYRR